MIVKKFKRVRVKPDGSFEEVEDHEWPGCFEPPDIELIELIE